MSSTESRPALARRLKTLRTRQWSDAQITQGALARALGGSKALSVSLISSWENVDRPVAPPVNRLEDYATFFATRKSVDGERIRLVEVHELSEAEQAHRASLLAELLWLRDGDTGVAAGSLGDLWRFPVGQDITIVCAELPRELRANPGYADPESPDFMALYNYADPDALIELFGHVRAVNPENQVNFHTTEELQPDHYTANLVLLGGVDWNSVTRDLLDRVELPVEQVLRDDDLGQRGGFRVRRDGQFETFEPVLDGKRLVEDIAHFYRGVSPFNQERTVSVCNGMYGRGTLGAVRALTDKRFRNRNQEYVEGRFGLTTSFSIISRVRVVQGQGLTPDWTLSDDRLHEWPEATS
ncbi:helix-turn-helix domain-containing protein [Amycolatopsis sp. OK19-0408]|uniref:Helix-turn-helix domain-containing protein n=1 Tax=Amycolatopsis iheyensis TaxID=2945988 RepID=A0A9X2NA50_9PSEU|nr:helix-turn-helix transcriptional regulator [Amycolatopsis iheyensis]MCR6483396.1 helix-turn-helix domain-containing protein [Amycolatopsis iheyensis]